MPASTHKALQDATRSNGTHTDRIAITPLDNSLTTWDEAHGFKNDYRGYRGIRATYMHTINYKLAARASGDVDWNLVPAITPVCEEDKFDVEDISEYTVDLHEQRNIRKPRKRPRGPSTQELLDEAKELQAIRMMFRREEERQRKEKEEREEKEEKEEKDGNDDDDEEEEDEEGKDTQEHDGNNDSSDGGKCCY